jgi:septal ring factor EnvC (AmiA/AmiB activator)
MQKYTLILILLVFLPSIVYAQAANQTTSITEEIIGLNTSLNNNLDQISSLENQINELKTRLNEVEKQKQLDEKFNQLITEFNKKQFIDGGWTQGEVLIGSATIFAFFGFSSFLVIRFESRRKDELVRSTLIILLCIWAIQILQLLVIVLIMREEFSADIYTKIIIVTGGLLSIVLYNVSLIVKLENRDRDRTQIRTEVVSDVLQQLIQKNNQSDQLNNRLGDLDRENKRLQQELGY